MEVQNYIFSFYIESSLVTTARLHPFCKILQIDMNEEQSKHQTANPQDLNNERNCTPMWHPHVS